MNFMNEFVQRMLYYWKTLTSFCPGGSFSEYISSLVEARFRESGEGFKQLALLAKSLLPEWPERKLPFPDEGSFYIALI